MLKALGMELQPQEIDGLYYRIDSKREGKIYFINFTQAYKVQIESDVRTIISSLIKPLYEKGKTLPNLLATFPQNNNYMKFNHLVDALQSIQSKFTKEDLSFLISYLAVKQNSNNEVNIDEFARQIEGACLRLHIITDTNMYVIFSRKEVSSPEKNAQFTFGKKAESFRYKNNSLADFKKKLGLTSKEKIMESFKLMDKDSNKQVTLTEFKRVVKRYNPDIIEHEINQVYSQLDDQGKKYFTMDEYLEKLGADIDSNPDSARQSSFRSTKSKTETLSKRESEFVEKTKWAKNLFTEMKQLLDQRSETFANYFRVQDGTTKQTGLKIKINKLGVKSVDVQKLLNNITEEQNNVDLKIFEKCFIVHTTTQEPQSVPDSARLDSPRVRVESPRVKAESQRSSVAGSGNIYTDIKEAMKKKNINFQSFKRLEIETTGKISGSTFELLARGELGINIPVDKMNQINKEIGDGSGNLYLDKLRNKLEPGTPSRKEEPFDAKELINSIKQAIKNNKMTAESLFNLMDKDKSKEIDYNEFHGFLSKLGTTFTSDKILKLFSTLEQTQTGRISYEEFLKHFEDEDEKVKRLVARLRDIISRSKMDLLRTFEYYDRQELGVIGFNNFKQVLLEYDRGMNLADIELIFKKLETPGTGTISKNVFIKELYQGTWQETNKKLAKDFLNEIAEKLTIKTEEDAANLYRIVDKNRNNKVSLEEFEEFVRAVCPHFTKNEPVAIFRIFDQDHSGFISYQEFMSQFGLSQLKSKKALPISQARSGSIDSKSQLIQKDRPIQTLLGQCSWASDIFEELSYLLIAEETNFDNYFFTSTSDFVDKGEVRRKFDMLGLQISNDKLESLFNTFTHQDPSTINLKEFRSCFFHFNQEAKRPQEEFKFKNLNELRLDIKKSLDYNRLTFNQAFAHLDKSGVGLVDKLDVQNVLVNKLGLRNTTKFKILFKYLSEGSNHIVLDKFENLLNNEKLANSRVNFSFSTIDQFRAGYHEPEPLKPIEAKEDVRVLIQRTKDAISKTRMSIDTIFKQFDYRADSELNWDEFYRGLKFFDKLFEKELTREEIWNMFEYLDKEKKRSISKLRFVQTFSDNTPELLVPFLDWAAPIFKEINQALEKNKIDILKLMKAENGYVDRSAFRSVIFFSGFDVDRKENDVNKIIEILQDPNTGMINIEAFRICLAKAQTPEVKPRKTVFTAEEKDQIKQMLTDISKYMRIDGLTFEQVFLAKDTNKRGSLTVEQMQDVLINELFIKPSPVLDLLYDYLMDSKGEIDLLKLREYIREQDREVKKIISLEFFLKEIKSRFNNDIDGIIRFFDYANKRKLNKRDFEDGCKRAMNLDSEIAQFYFANLDDDNDGIVTTLQFRDILESDLTERKEFLKNATNFIIANKNAILRNMQILQEDPKDTFLPLEHLKIGFSNSGLKMSIEDLEALVDEFQLEKDARGRYNYMKFIESAVVKIEKQQDQLLAEVDHLMQRIKAHVVAHRIDLGMELAKVNKKGDGYIQYQTLFVELSRYNIFLQRDEKDALYPLLKPREDGCIDYREFVKLVISGRDKKLTKEEMLRESIWVKDLIAMIKQIMKKNYLTVARLFGGDKERIPLTDFKLGLGYIGFKEETEEVVKLCKLIQDDDKGEFVSLPRFEFLLDNTLDDSLPTTEETRGNYRDAKFLEERFKDIRTFMIQDRLTFDELFTRNAKAKDGTMTAKELEYVLTEGLGLEVDNTLKKFISLVLDRRGVVELKDLERSLNVPTAYSKPVVESNYQSRNTLMLGTQSGKGDTSRRSVLPVYAGPISVIDQGSISTSRRPSRELRQMLAGPSMVDFSGKLDEDIKLFFKVKKFSNQERFRLFDEEGHGKISDKVFLDVVKSFSIRGVRDQDILNLFKKIDTNKTGFISENEFRLWFDTEDGKEPSQRGVILTRDLYSEIDALFRELDTDQSGFLTIDEMIRCMSKLGVSTTSEDVAKIFDRIDKNKDGKISPEEFREVMEEKIKKDILQLDDLLSDLRAEFKKADVNNTRELTPPQLYQALTNLGIQLTESELISLVNAIDKDRSGTIDIDEFIGFLLSPPDKTSLGNEADSAIFNIRRANKISPLDLIEAFKNMPFNFIFSFTRDLTKKMENLPSSALKPKTRSSGMFYEDILPNFPLKQKNTEPKSKNAQVPVYYSIRPIASAIAAEIKLTLATGVPIPDAKAIDRASTIVGREVRACIFSKNINKYVSNIVNIPADWKSQYEGN